MLPGAFRAADTKKAQEIQKIVISMWENIVVIHKGIYGLIFEQIKDLAFLAPFSSFKISSILLGLLCGINVLIAELLFLELFDLSANWKIPLLSLLIIIVLNFLYFLRLPNRISSCLAYSALPVDQKESLSKLVRTILITDILCLCVLYS